MPISCGNCGGVHDTVAEVRSCHQVAPAAPGDAPASSEDSFDWSEGPGFGSRPPDRSGAASCLVTRGPAPAAHPHGPGGARPLAGHPSRPGRPDGLGLVPASRPRRRGAARPHRGDRPTGRAVVRPTALRRRARRCPRPPPRRDRRAGALAPRPLVHPSCSSASPTWCGPTLSTCATRPSRPPRRSPSPWPPAPRSPTSRPLVDVRTPAGEPAWCDGGPLDLSASPPRLPTTAPPSCTARGSSTAGSPPAADPAPTAGARCRPARRTSPTRAGRAG